MHQPIRFYFSFRSPFAGIALHRALHGPDFRDVTFELMPVWPEIIFGGHMDNPTDNLFKLVYVFQDAARQADVAGLDSGFLRALSQRITLPEDADYRLEKVGLKTGPEPWEITHGAFLYAQRHGAGNAFAEAIFTRRFGFDGNPTADVLMPEVVAQIAEGLGLDGSAAAGAHRDPDIVATIDAVRCQGERDGVFGVPFFVLEREGGRETFWGNDHLEYLLRSLRGSGALPLVPRPEPQITSSTV